MLAVGELLLDGVDERTQKMTTGFSGGIGRKERDMCGGFSAGVMLIGALYGRTKPDQEEEPCMRLCTNFRDRFVEAFGTLNCHELRTKKNFGSNGDTPCWVLVERTVYLFFAVLEDDLSES